MPYTDHPDNILGVNSADNQFTSNLVAANATGSMIERQQYAQGLLEALTAGTAILKGTAAAGTDSTTVVAVAALAGFTNDFFNDHFYMQILVNANSAGAAPESEVRKITDYVSATGTFTVDAFSSAIEASDLLVVLHESAIAVGRNDANNVFDSSSVTANANGSVLERLAYIQSLTDTEIAAIKAVTDALPDAGAMTALSNAIETIDNLIDGAALEKLTGAADGTDVYPDTVANDSVIAKIISKANPAASSSYNNTTDSLEAISDKIDAVDDYIDTEIAAITALFTVPTQDLATDATMNQVVGKKSDTVGGTSLVAIGKQIVAAVGVVDGLLDVPTEDLATDATVNQVVGKKSDTVGGTSLVALAKQGIAAIGVVDGLLDVPTEDLATDVTINQVVGKKSDTVAGTSLVAIGKQILAAVDTVDNFVDTEITALGTAVDAFAAAGGDGKAVVRKTVTFSNTDADVNLFSITAGVNFRLYAFCTTNCESAGTCTIGVDLGATAVIADTASTDLEANDVWHDATPDASVELTSVHEQYTAYGGTIVLDVEAAHQVDSGVLVFVCVYAPLTSDGAVAAA